MSNVLFAGMEWRAVEQRGSVITIRRRRVQISVHVGVVVPLAIAVKE